MPSPSNRRAWLTALASAGVSLGLGALSLWLILPLIDGRPAGAGGEVALTDSDFEPTLAAPLLRDMPVEERPPYSARAMLLMTAASIEAAEYPLLEIDATLMDAGSQLYLFWRRNDQPETLHHRLLEGAGSGQSWHELSSDEQWRGTIAQLAIGGFGSRNASTPELSSLALHAGRRAARISQLWWQWTDFGPWRMSTINVYPGSTPDTALRPTAAASAWVLLSLLLLALLFWRQRGATRPWLIAAVLVVAVPWLGLDRLWQSRLAGQVDVSEARFGGLTQVEKHEREHDRELQRFARRVARAMPAHDPSRRLFLLHDSRGQNYWRLRLQYHLLPRNIYNFGRALPVAQLRAGDYLLVLGELEDMRFDRQRDFLFGRDGRVAAERVLRRPAGALYRILPADGASET